MTVVKQISILKSDGTTSDADIGAKVENIDYDETKKLNTKLGEMDAIINGKAPYKHWATDTYQADAFGKADSTHWGHVRMTDDYTNNASFNGAVLSHKGAVNMYNELKNSRGGFPADCEDAMLHNNIYRGIELVGIGDDYPYHSLHDLAVDVSLGNFSNIYIGDTITITSTVGTTPLNITWVVMGINSYLNRSILYIDHSTEPATVSYNEGVRVPHLVLVPKEIYLFYNMYNDISGNNFQAYSHSAMHIYLSGGDMTTSGPTCSFLSGFKLPSSELSGEHYLISYPEFMGCKVNNDNVTIAREVKTCFSSLLSEPEVFGTAMLSSSSYDIGTNNIQLPGFRLNPSLTNKSFYTTGSEEYCRWWLSAVSKNETSTAKRFCTVSGSIVNAEDANLSALIPSPVIPSGMDATEAIGVVPKVLFGGVTYYSQQS